MRDCTYDSAACEGSPASLGPHGVMVEGDACSPSCGGGDTMGVTAVCVSNVDSHENRIDALGPSMVDFCTAKCLCLTCCTMPDETYESLHTGVSASYEEVTPFACEVNTFTVTSNMNYFEECGMTT